MDSTQSDEGVAARRAEVVALLEGRRAERAHAREERRSTLSGDAAPADFWAAFGSAVAGLHQSFAAASSEPVAAGDADADARTRRAAALHGDWVRAISVLQAMLNEATPSLPPFEVRKAQARVAAVAAEAEEARGRLQPRSRFRFSRRREREAAAAVTQPDAAEGKLGGTGAAALGTPTTRRMADGDVTAGGVRGALAREKPAAAARADTDEDVADSSVTRRAVHLWSGSGGHPVSGGPALGGSAGLSTDGDDEFVVQSITGEPVLVLSGDGGSGSAGSQLPPPPPPGARVFDFRGGQRDVRLAALTDCVVVVRGVTRALRVDGLVRCTLLCGPVAGSVLLHGATGCTFMLAARQLRAHDSRDCAFYLCVRSRPIIEGCTRVAFAPYRLRYAGWDADAAAADAAAAAGATVVDGAAALDATAAATDASADLWRAVDDFGWHRVQRSPNWSEVPDVDRVGQPGAAARLAPAAVAYGLWIEGGSGEAAAPGPAPLAERAGDEDEF